MMMIMVMGKKNSLSHKTIKIEQTSTIYKVLVVSDSAPLLKNLSAKLQNNTQLIIEHMFVLI